VKNITDNLWTVVINPASGNGLAMKQWKTAEIILQSKGFNYNVCHTQPEGKTIEMVKGIIENGCNHLIVMGGDGTLNEVANGIMLQKRYASHEVKVGVVPIGTGNDWIKTADIPTNTNDAINIICNGKTSLQDIGRATYQINNSKHVRYFVNTAGSGLDSIVINKVSQKKTRSKNKGTNKLVYILTLLAEFTKYKPIEVTLETDNGTTLKGNMLNFAIGIGKYNGGGMLPFPNANPGNNLFEVLFISNMPKIRMLFALPKLFSGTLDKVKEVKYIRSKKIKLSSTTPIFAETDGEIIGYTPILFDIEPLAFCYFSK
jgi:YegS/Rv2252/BmrU family lipid kinase